MEAMAFPFKIGLLPYTVAPNGWTQTTERPFFGESMIY